MTYFKRFTEFCGTFSLFVSLMFLFRRWMEFKSVDASTLLSRIRLFFDPETQSNHRAMLLLVLLLTSALIISRAFAKFPWIGLLCSVFPMVQVLFLFEQEEFFEHPMLHLILVSLFVFGHLADALVLDRIDGRRRAYLATQLLGLLLFLLGIFVYVLGVHLLKQGQKETLSPLLSAIHRGALEGSHTLWLITSLATGFGTLCSWGLRDVYFVDLLLALAPVFPILWWFHSEKELSYFMALLFFVSLLLVSRLLLMLFEPPKTERRNREKTLDKSIEIM